jgi:hypothetical protein
MRNGAVPATGGKAYQATTERANPITTVTACGRVGMIAVSQCCGWETCPPVRRSRRFLRAAAAAPVSQPVDEGKLRKYETCPATSA